MNGQFERKGVIDLKLGIEISGAIYADVGDITHDLFLDKFIEFVELNGWHFGGSTKQIDENGDSLISRGSIVGRDGFTECK